MFDKSPQFKIPMSTHAIKGGFHGRNSNNSIDAGLLPFSNSTLNL